jgi:hypothetical protein
LIFFYGMILLHFHTKKGSMQRFKKKLIGFLIFFTLPLLFLVQQSYAQNIIADSIPNDAHKTVIAGKQYSASGLKKKLWGKHYRKEWTTPVKVSILNLDTIYGGLTPVEKGGGRQTKNLRLKDKEGKEYVLRSVDKNFGSALPDIASGTFLEDIVNDQVSTEHPYGALTIAPMAEAAGIYHTNPQIVFIPHSATLREFDADFGDQLYLFEERPDDDQRNAAYFGNSPEVISTEKMMEAVSAKNNHFVDQAFYIRSRLFDMFLSDWGRHEDQWRWASFDVQEGKMYRPIPRDRDQAYTLFDGLLVGLTKSSIQFGLESFGKKIDDVKTYNYPARFLDRRFTNKISLETWISIAADMKRKLTDQVIEDAIAKLPPEIYPISGKTIIEKLKSRRNDLEKYARDYYLFLTEEVDVTGTLENEWFEISHTGNGITTIEMYSIDKDNKKGAALYSRSFSRKETEEIRVYGLGGNDQYHVNGDENSGIKIRIIGGPGKDNYYTEEGKRGMPVFIYDNHDNDFTALKKAKLKLSEDSAVNRYNYNEFKYDKQGIKKGISYNNKDRLFLRTGFYIERSHWRKSPYGFRQDFNVNYSLIQNAFSVQYKALFVRAIGSWNIALEGEYDAVRDFHFAGVGNETKINPDIKKFYRIRTRDYYFDAGLNKNFGANQQLGFYAFYQGFKLLYDNLKFISQYPITNPIFKTRDYAGLRGQYVYLKLNDNVVPSKGLGFSSEVSYTRPFDKLAKPFTRLVGNFGFYLPIVKHLSFASRTAASTLTENADFNQLSRIGGAATMRGYLRFRFYGKSSFLNSNELQWTTDFRSHIMNGKIGLVGFFDNGRVWQPGEVSDTWHTSFGGGILLAPFNKMVGLATYGVTNEGNRINFRLGRLF